MSTGSQVSQDRVVAFVRVQTFRARSGLDMLFVAIDVARGAIMTAWLIPSTVFAGYAGEPNGKGRLRFSASMKPGSKDRWTPCRLAPEQLPAAILARLAERESAI